MIRGRVGPITGIPYVEGYLDLPGLNASGRVTFLVDTGADTTLLLPSGLDLLGINYANLPGRPDQSASIGGVVPAKKVPAVISFTGDRQNLYVYRMDISVLEPRAELNEWPSLLGIDLLRNWRMRYSPSRYSLSFSVDTADHIYERPP